MASRDKASKERCLMCLTWHEPGEHKIVEVPPVLTGQVPASQVKVSGNHDDDS